MQGHLKQKWRVRAKFRLIRWKRKLSLSEPRTLMEKSTIADIELLETIADWEETLLPPQEVDESDYYDDEPTRYLQIDKAPIFKRLQDATPILIYGQGRRLERLTRFLIILTGVLSVLTAISIITLILEH